MFDKTINEENFALLENPEKREEAIEKLLKNNEPLVMNIVKNFSNTNDYTNQQDDLFNIGLNGLFQAIKTYKTEREVNFSSYAAVCIKNEIFKYLKKLKAPINKETGEKIVFESYDVPINNMSDIKKWDTMANSCKTPEENAIQTEKTKQFKEVIKELSPRFAIVLVLKFGLFGEKEHTNQEISERIGINTVYVRKVLYEAKQSLKRLLEKKAHKTEGENE